MRSSAQPVTQRLGPCLKPSPTKGSKLLVEPFQDVTGTAEGATIAMGLTEEVIGKLASFKDLVVVLLDPRRPNSAVRAARTDPAMRYTLTGSVRVEGDAIRLSARLIDRTNGSVLWANTYDGSKRVGTLLDMEADIAGDVTIGTGKIRMATRRQLEANRANAKRSTGPRSADGKAKSSKNSLAHGLTAQDIVIADEDPRRIRAAASWPPG